MSVGSEYFAFSYAVAVQPHLENFPEDILNTRYYPVTSDSFGPPPGEQENGRALVAPFVQF